MGQLSRGKLFTSQNSFLKSTNFTSEKTGVNKKIAGTIPHENSAILQINYLN